MIHRRSYRAHITFDNFRQVLFQSNFVRYFMNSIFITLVTTLICMILSVMAAYGLTRYRIVGARENQDGGSYDKNVSGNPVVYSLLYYYETVESD